MSSWAFSHLSENPPGARCRNLCQVSLFGALRSQPVPVVPIETKLSPPLLPRKPWSTCLPSLPCPTPFVLSQPISSSCQTLGAKTPRLLMPQRQEGCLQRGVIALSSARPDSIWARDSADEGLSGKGDDRTAEAPGSGPVLPAVF